ncbi:MAG: ABC transporter substrate-binding protein [archaeon]
MSSFFNSKSKKMILGVILLVVLVGASYGVYISYLVSDPEPEETEPEPTTVTVTDVNGVSVTVTLPVNRIVSLTNGVTEIIYALGGGDAVVGRDASSNFPAVTSEIPVVYESALNMEVLTDLDPDLIIADARINDETRAEIEELLEVPVIIDNPSQTDRVEPLITNLGLILNNQETADELLGFISQYSNIVAERVSALSDDEKPVVYYEWVREWFSCNNASLPHCMLTDAGALNLAANQITTYPTLSPEYVLECNPDIILRIISSANHTETEFQTSRDEIMNRTGLIETTAVQEGNVYIMDGYLRTGIRNVIGLVTLANCFHPDLFEDIDPNAVHEELVQTFFGTNLEGVYFFPSEPIEPKPEGETITIVDGDEAEVTLTLPVNRIGCLNGGLAEVICALGGEDKIVARTDDVAFPVSLLDTPSVGLNAASAINLEVLMSLHPDLVVASSALDDETIEIIRSFGVPVIIESTSNIDRLETIVTNFGQILDAPTKAEQILSNNEYYTNIVQERLQNLSTAERTTFYYEFRRIWYSMTNQTNMGKILDDCGGVNIASNSSVRYATLSAEYVIEQNPEVIIYSLSGTTNLTDYQAALNELLTRPELQNVPAVKNNRVHVFYYYLGAGIRYPVGELYFAKWFYPDLFADIDPSAVHEQLIRDYFGEPLEGTYAYPETVTVVDALGNKVTINLPVNRIVSLTGGLTEIVCALGAENLIVGRGDYSTFPPSVVEIPVASPSSYSVNMETLLEFEPDLVLADTMMKSKPEYIEQIQAAGIPLIVENTANISRITPIINTLGVIVNNQEKATELVEWIDQYVDLVKERTATLSEREFPSVYIEWTSSWRAIGPAHAIGELMATAGGTNIITNASATTTTVSPEFVLTANPDFMFVTTASMPAPTEVSFYENKMADVLSQTGISSTTAATEENIHLYSYRLIQGIRYPIGLLYFADWLHPTLYEDINPGTVLENMIDQFFGIELDAIYVYP